MTICSGPMALRGRAALHLLAIALVCCISVKGQTCQASCPQANPACLSSSPASVLSDFCKYPATGCGGNAATAFVVGGKPCCRPAGSPIIIDVDGGGFHLTSAEDGVDFDFFGNGVPVRIAWTAVGSTNGILVRDVYGTGKIIDGAEMFGNLTPQPPSSDPNGFNALAQYDMNADGWIDRHDPVWGSLLLWIDENHNGISEPGELHSLDSLGIKKISVEYKEVDKTDANGNQFRYRARVNDDGSRFAYDVFLVYMAVSTESNVSQQGK